MAVLCEVLVMYERRLITEYKVSLRGDFSGEVCDWKPFFRADLRGDTIFDPAGTAGALAKPTASSSTFELTETLSAAAT